MNSRELSEKLDSLATQLVDSNGDLFLQVAEELRKLSNQNYAPGNSVSWDAIKPKPATKSKGGFISNKGTAMPF